MPEIHCVHFPLHSRYTSSPTRRSFAERWSPCCASTTTTQNTFCRWTGCPPLGPQGNTTPLPARVPASRRDLTHSIGHSFTCDNMWVPFFFRVKRRLVIRRVRSSFLQLLHETYRLAAAAIGALGLQLIENSPQDFRFFCRCRCRL